MRLATIAALLFAAAAFAQESATFPRFSILAGRYDAQFSTDTRVDPVGTELNLERDLGLRRSRGLDDLALRWRPFSRHELAASYLSASRSGAAVIHREFRFNNRIYPVDALATTTFNTKKWEATYTYWLAQSPRGGFGLTLGAAELSLDASVSAQALTITERANTRVPVALAGAQARVAFTPQIIGEVSAAALPHVKIDVYSGDATSASARLEWRFAHNVGVGVAYNYFNIDGTFTDPSFAGRLKMTTKGGEGFVRLGF